MISTNTVRAIVRDVEILDDRVRSLTKRVEMLETAARAETARKILRESTEPMPWPLHAPPEDWGPRGDIALRIARLRDVWRELDTLMEQFQASGGK